MRFDEVGGKVLLKIENGGDYADLDLDLDLNQEIVQKCTRTTGGTSVQ